MRDASEYALDFPGEEWTTRERLMLAPFASNLEGHVTVLRNLPAEVVGALCSRTSRAKGSLLRILYREYLEPIASGEDKELAGELLATINFLRDHGFKNILNSQRAQAFYAKWLSQYGDDSIAQETGAHVVFWGISQIAMKHLEDQRIGLEPIEKSTRYVDFGEKVAERYLYYTPRPDLEALGLLERYEEVLDRLFDTYLALRAPLLKWLRENFDEKEAVLEKKSFDTLRGLLPMATLGQVAFRGNAQAYEYAINRSALHPLGEIRWIAGELKRELDTEIPSLLLRLGDEKSEEYQRYLGGKSSRVREVLREVNERWQNNALQSHSGGIPHAHVRLEEWDEEGELKVIAGILYPETHWSWHETFQRAHALTPEERVDILSAYLEGRTARWQKVGRAFENVFNRFDIGMNIGAYRDLHRHRMLTQQRQRFSCHHGFDIPEEVIEAGLASLFAEPMEEAARLSFDIEAYDRDLAQYVVPLGYRMRFQQYENLRQTFWQAELRTIPQGHPDYRAIEQKKFDLLQPVYPTITRFMRVDMENYPFARRGVEEAIAAKERRIIEKLGGL